MIALIFIIPEAKLSGVGLNRTRGWAIRCRSDEVPAKLCNETGGSTVVTKFFPVSLRHHKCQLHPLAE